MPKSRKAVIGGPFITNALFCERVLEEKDGVLTPVRIIDTLTVHIVPVSARAEQQLENKPSKITRELSALITIKSGDLVGKRTLRVVCKSLSIDQSLPVVFEGGHHGANLNIRLRLEMPEGTHWFSLYLSGKLLTKTPLRAVILWGQADSTDAESITPS
jgi:hypothetical protein